MWANTSGNEDRCGERASSSVGEIEETLSEKFWEGQTSQTEVCF